MKNLIFISLLMLIHVVTFAQGIAINETGLSAEPTSLLDINSTTKGILVPRMNTVERLAIVDPAEGLLVYDIDTHTFWYNTNSVWKQILKTGDGGFSLPYAGVGADPDKLFSITNNSAAPSTAIYGRRFGGSGLGLSTSNGIWGDNMDGNGVAGTSDSNNGVAGFSNTGFGVSATSISGTGMYANSTTGFGISSISQFNFGLASTSNGVDKPGVLGVNGNNTGAGYGVIGLIENPTGGAGVWGKNNATGGHAGLFTTTNAANSENALKASTIGNGAAGYFTTSGVGHAIKIENTNANNTVTTLQATTNGVGATAYFATSGTGAVGSFATNNANNTNPTIFINNQGKGNGINLYQGAASTNHGIYVDGQGTGTSVYSITSHGKAGLFNIVYPINDESSLNASTIGTGLAATFIKNNTTGSNSDIHDPAVYVDNNSLGAGLKVYSHHSNSVNHGVNINYEGLAFGLGVSSNRGAILATTTGTNTTVLATNYNGGMAIKGIASGGDTSAVYGEASGAHGIGIKGFSTHALGRGVLGQNSSEIYSAVTGINNEAGGGVMGIYNGGAGEVGYGVLGETDYLSDGIAAKFSVNNATNPYPVVWTSNSGLGPSLSILANNDNSTGIAIEINQSGTGKFASFSTDVDEKFAINHNGNISTDGTITTASTLTVKNNKGIVRNSTATQMRMETINAQMVYFDMPQGNTATEDLTFSTSFSSPPIVTIGNLMSGYTGPCWKMVMSVDNVTTTGCTINMYNPAASGNPDLSGTWKILVVGAE